MNKVVKEGCNESKRYNSSSHAKDTVNFDQLLLLTTATAHCQPVPSHTLQIFGDVGKIKIQKCHYNPSEIVSNIF